MEPQIMATTHSNGDAFLMCFDQDLEIGIQEATHEDGFLNLPSVNENRPTS